MICPLSMRTRNVAAGKHSSTMPCISMKPFEREASPPDVVAGSFGDLFFFLRCPLIEGVESKITDLAVEAKVLGYTCTNDTV